MDAFVGKEIAMEDLTPPLLTAVREVKWHLSSGKSMKEAFNRYLDCAHDAFSEDFRRRWVLKQQGMTLRPPKTALQQAFWELIERGSAGQPSLEALSLLEIEVEKAAQAELEAHIAALPFKVLVPLLLFQFPAYLILLLGPVLRELTARMAPPLLFVMLLFAFSAHVSPLLAQTADDLLVSKINRAKSSARIAQIQKEWEELRIARKACRLQLQARDAPTECYSALENERRWGISHSARNWRTTRQKLDRLCEQAARELRIPKRTPEKARIISSTCLKHMSAAREIQEYRSQSGTKDPDAVFGGPGF
jgi:hypothetical protein